MPWFIKICNCNRNTIVWISATATQTLICNTFKIKLICTTLIYINAIFTLIDLNTLNKLKARNIYDVLLKKQDTCRDHIVTNKRNKLNNFKAKRYCLTHYSLEYDAFEIVPMFWKRRLNARFTLNVSLNKNIWNLMFPCQIHTYYRFSDCGIFFFFCYFSCQFQCSAALTTWGRCTHTVGVCLACLICSVLSVGENN
jgi:hypothetical protein